MNTHPLVSVCINCYNAKDTIMPTLQSVLDQTYRNLQIIIVDDCSTDGTWELLQRIDDDRVECIRLPENGHISNANNEALRRVRGDFVAHLDADDRWVPEKIEKQLAFLQEHPEYGACFSIAEMVDEQGNSVDDHRFRAENRDRASLLRHFLTVGNYLNHSSMFARREIIDRVGEHDLTLLYFHDFDYWIRMAMICDIYISSEKLVYCRLSSASNSAMQDDKKNSHIYEFAQIAYQTVVSCPDELFLEAFSDRLRLSGTHSPEQTALEKAFLLNDLLIYLPQNHALGLRRLCELMSERTYAEIARRDFGFSARDLYQLQSTPVYHDETAARTAYDTTVHLNNLLAAANAENGWFKEHAAQLEEERTRIIAHADRLQNVCDQLNAANTDLTNRNADLTVQNAELTDCKTLLTERCAIHAEHNAVLTDHIALLTNRNAALDAQIAALVAENASLNARAIGAEAAHAHTQQQLALIHGGLSWRITKPLRVIKRLFRG